MIATVGDSSDVSTHSRLKAAGLPPPYQQSGKYVSTHSRLKAAGLHLQPVGAAPCVSTHSRLKAAGAGISADMRVRTERFNTQPPEGGWK